MSARDFAGARIEQPVTASFTAEPDGDEVRMTLRAKALVHGECARCLDPVAINFLRSNCIVHLIKGCFVSIAPKPTFVNTKTGRKPKKF